MFCGVPENTTLSIFKMLAGLVKNNNVIKFALKIIAG